MVLPAAAAHGVLLEGPQSRTGLAGIEEHTIGTFQFGDVPGRQGSDAAGMQGQIEDRPLQGQQIPRLAGDLQKPIPGSETFPVPDLPLQLQRIDLRQCLDILPAGEDPFAFGQDVGTDRTGFGNPGEEIPPSQILFDGFADEIFDQVLRDGHRISSIRSKASFA